MLHPLFFFLCNGVAPHAVCALQAALLLGMGIVPDTANRMAQTAEQLAPVSDRHFHLKATVTASAAKGLHKKFLKSFFSNRAAKQEFVQTLVSDEKVKL